MRTIERDMSLNSADLLLPPLPLHARVQKVASATTISSNEEEDEEDSKNRDQYDEEKREKLR